MQNLIKSTIQSGNNFVISLEKGELCSETILHLIFKIIITFRPYVSIWFLDGISSDIFLKWNKLSSAWLSVEFELLTQTLYNT